MQHSKHRILVVDDEVAVTEALCDLLDVLGCATEVAHDGQGALDLIAGSLPDLVILDRMMPDMDGIEVLRQIRANRETARLPVIMLTGLGSIGSTVEGVSAGATMYVEKPANAEKISRLVTAILGPPVVAPRDQGA